MDQATEVTALPTPKAGRPDPLTVLDVVKFFAGEKINKLDETRLARLTRKFASTAQADLKSVCKEYIESEERNGAPAKLVAQVRASEMKTLYGFTVTLGKSVAGLSYHAAITEGRAALKAAGKKWDGGAILGKKEREVKNHAKQVGAMAEAEYIEVAGLQNRTGREITPEERVAIRDQLEQRAEREAQAELAAGFVKKHGTDWCERLIECLTAEIHKAHSEAVAPVQEATGTNG